jgi:hypothetical protein
MNKVEKEKIQLAKRFRDELVKQRAEELGVETQDLMTRVSDGKHSLVKKSSVYIQLEKQRQLVAPKKVLRALRDGQDSIVHLIQDEIQLCRKLLNDLEKIGAIESSNISDYKAGLVKLENRTNSFTNQLVAYETKIERTKKQETVFGEAESVLAEVYKARQQNDMQKVQALMLQHRDLLKKYETQRKLLNPHIEGARKVRYDMQKEYWLIMESRYKIHSLSILQMKKNLVDLSQSIILPNVKQEFQSDIAMLQKRQEQLNDTYRNIVSHCPPSHIEQTEAIKIWDTILPNMKTVLQHLSDIDQLFQDLITKYKNLPLNSDSDTGDAPKRMVYAERKEKE